MADMTTAKAGDKISDKAVLKLQEAMGAMRGALIRLDVPTTVEAKSPGEDGRWFCITCGYFPMHNMDAWSHASTRQVQSE